MPTTDLEIILYPELFDERRRDVLRTGEWIVTAWRYSTGIVALRISNSRGYIEALPFMGQILWDAVFDGQSLRMDNMFDMPVPARQIVETYGCFAFHSGLLAAGCPSPETITHYMESFPVHQCARQVLLQGTNPVALLPSHCPVNMSTA